MKHLTVDEMIDFVSFNDLEPETLALASRVSAHILTCEACRAKVEAFQSVYDEFVRTNRFDALTDEAAEAAKKAEARRLLGESLSK